MSAVAGPVRVMLVDSNFICGVIEAPSHVSLRSSSMKPAGGAGMAREFSSTVAVSFAVSGWAGSSVMSAVKVRNWAV